MRAVVPVEIEDSDAIHNIPTEITRLSATCLLFAWWVVLVSARDKHHFIQQDVNAELVCDGRLSEYAACQCKQSDGEVACINAQFVDPNIFLDVAANYKSLYSVTFHGNNFLNLPASHLFGDSRQSNLYKLNISANYIVNLNSEAMQGMPNLKVLDMSNNEIVLKAGDVDFLTHTPQLTHVLDLSYNSLQSVPFPIACPFPSMVSLDLRQNFLKNFNVNESCIRSITTINLSRNKFNTISPSFELIAKNARPNTFIMRNPFICDCHAKQFIPWLRKTDAIRDRNNLICDRASPVEFVGKRIIEVPEHQLTCNDRLINASRTKIALACLIILFLL